eukprot:11547_1
MEVMQPVKKLMNKAITEIKQIDPYDRKVQITAVISITATIYVCIKVTRKRNFWNEMPAYKKATEQELGDARKLALLERCSKPSDILQVILAESGAASLKPLTIQQLWNEAVENAGDKPCIAVEELQDDGCWKYVFKTWNQTNNEFDRIAKALIAIGIKQFDICNIIGSCSPMFQYIFFGIIFSGAIPGGCYTTNLSGSLKYICNLCKTKIVFAEDKTQLNKYMEVINELKSVKYIIVYDDKSFSNNDDEKQNEYENKKGIKILSFTQFMKYNDANKQLTKELETRKQSANPKQCAIVLYTSGTTGGSKGCMLSHDNIISMCHSSASTYNQSGGQLPNTDMRQITYLPLSHIAGQILSWWSPIYYCSKRNHPSTTYYARKDWKKTLKISLMNCQPNSFVSVPRMYEKFYEGMLAGLTNAGFIANVIFNFTLWIGKDYYYNTQAGGNGDIPLLWPFVKNILCDGIIKNKIGFRDCTKFASGGGSLSKTVRETFASLNMPLVDAYGLSETAGPIALSRPNNYVPGACGPVMMGSEILIDHVDGRDDKNHGEICYRGRHAMMGYINEIEKTRAVFDDEGFFHTGDIGYIDEYDCVHITGRIKELLVTAGGENVAPVPVEEYIKKMCPALSQVIMIGDKKKYCSMVVSIACEVDDNGVPTEELQAHAKNVNKSVNSVEEAMNDEIWHEYVRNGILKYNNDKDVCVSNTCRIKYFQILHEDLSVYNGTLAASLKVKRHKLYDVYQKEMDALYGNNPQIPVAPRR